ncbi:MAG: ATP-binding protein [bacterium]|nr:ATP-binding protein [bacterium]
MKFSIGTKLFLSFLCVLSFALGVGIYFLVVTEKALQEAVGQTSLFLAEDLIERIDKDIFDKIEQIQLYVQDTPLQEELQSSNQAFEELSDSLDYIQKQDEVWRAFPEQEVSPFMEELITGKISDSLRNEFLVFWEQKYGFPAYGEVFVTNRYGVNIAQTGKTSDYYQADEAWWQKAMENGFFVDNIEYDESAQIWTMPIGVRIDGEQGEFLGVIKAIPLAQELFAQAELTGKRYETTRIWLLTAEGNLIYSTGSFQMFRDLSQEDFFQRSRKGQGFFVSTEGESEKLFAYVQSGGFRDFSGLGWTLLIGHDTSEVFAPIRNLQRTFILVGIVLFLLAATFAVVFSRMISLPLKKLTMAAELISKGNLDVSIEVMSQDEIGKLAEAFGNMTKELRELYASLEQKVQARTEELKSQVIELDKTAKLLVRRDLELSEIREREQSKLKELDVNSRRLVRRDFELMQANEKLREMDHIKSEFVSIAAHQLRTPLTGIKWTLYSLLEEDVGKLNAEQKKFATDSYRSTNRLIELVNDLLDVARLEEGRAGFVMRQQALDPIIAKTVKRFKKAAKEKGISFSLELPSSGLPLISCDDEKIGIVLENVLDNAVKYTPPGGKIKMSVKEEKNHLTIKVQDTGIGVPSEQVSRVFSKFFRGENARLYQTSGTGLGLYLAQNIVEYHGGTISFASKENEGSTITLSLPIPEQKKTSD